MYNNNGKDMNYNKGVTRVGGLPENPLSEEDDVPLIYRISGRRDVDVDYDDKICTITCV